MVCGRQPQVSSPRPAIHPSRNRVESRFCAVRPIQAFAPKEKFVVIATTDIAKGWIYRTRKNQERLVLGWDRDGRVVYTSRGSDKANPFRNCHVRCSENRFVDAVEAKLGEMPDLESYIIANKARTVVVR